MTPKGDKLVAAKMKAAKMVDDELQQRIMAVFQLLDPFEIDLTYPAFEAAFLAEVDRAGGRHFNLQKAFLNAYIPVEFGKPTIGADSDYIPMGRAQREAVSASISTVTRASIKTHSSRGHSILKAYKDAGTRAVGVAKRGARKPARDLTGTVSRRTKGLGYYKRVLTGSESCSWCHMIASRGAVYTIDTVEGAWHTDCDCEALPASANSGPTPTYDQKLLTKKKKTGLDKEKIKANIAEYERKVAAGEIVPTPLPPRPTYV